MKWYVVAELTVTDRAWTRPYVEQVTKMVEGHGGRYLSRTTNFEAIEPGASTPHLLLVIEWPSREHALRFYESAEYRPFRDSRLAGSRGSFYLVPGEDSNGLARID